MNIAFDTTISLMGLASVAVSAGTAVFAWYRTRTRDLEERLKEGSDRMNRHDARIERIEQTVRGLPAASDMHTLELRLVEMSGDLKALAAVMEGNTKVMSRLESIVSRHEDHLLEGGKR
ncbi:DUF2730 family protein [Acidimangrovimonas sediminis]|uniref:DUF2730 family protein n=1 Tax=Acidimangrovimonas sediminis TaxID=2056283 RepID=UPI001E344414|nr:DUF2730 family protein [Acidimangrovimonas sediminis]